MTDQNVVGSFGISGALATVAYALSDSWVTAISTIGAAIVTTVGVVVAAYLAKNRPQPASQSTELKRLRRRVRKLQAERDMLRREVEMLRKQSGPTDGG